MRALRLHWIVVLALVLVAAIVVAFFAWPTARDSVLVVSSAISLAVLVGQHLYRRIGSVRLAIDRIRMRWLTRPEVELNMKASFELGSDDLAAARDALLNVMATTNPPARLLAEGDRAITWTLNGVTIRAAIEPVGDPIPGIDTPFAI